MRVQGLGLQVRKIRGCARIGEPIEMQVALRISGYVLNLESPRWPYAHGNKTVLAEPCARFCMVAVQQPNLITILGKLS